MKRRRASNELFAVFTVVLVLTVVKTDVIRPRGVSIAKAGLYNVKKDFTCFDNSLTIPFSQVNDFYCDCPDASDEPGTPACPNGVFHCVNAGHKALEIFASRVNDGICDCCDGTDEYEGTTCPNNCKELGQHAREEAVRLAERVKAGLEIKAEMRNEGLKLKKQKKEDIVGLQKQKEEAEKVLKEKEEIKKQVEELENVALDAYRKIEEEMKQKKAEEEAAKTREEATTTFVLFDSNEDGLLSIVELQTRQPFDTDRNGEVSVEEAKVYLDNRESINLEDFIIYAWPLIKPVMMRESGLFKPPAGVGQVEEVPLGQSKEVHEEVDEDLQQDTAEPIEEDEEEEEEDTGDADAEQQDTEEEEDTPKIEYDAETQNLVQRATEARSDFADAEHAVRNIETEITQVEEYLRRDFGPEEAFAPLYGQCFEYTDHEYIYKLCPFDKAVQQAKSNSLDTRLGTWAKWSGPESNIYDSMMYDNGQSCWNGPQRSTKVKVICGTENKLISVAEPNRCEYFFEFTTPAHCYENETHQDVHDEL